MADINKINSSLGYNFNNRVTMGRPRLPVSSAVIDNTTETYIDTPRVGEDGLIIDGGIAGDTSIYELIASKNQPSGYAGLDENGEMIAEVIARTGTAASLANFIPRAGQFAYATDSGKVVIGNGVEVSGVVTGTTFANLGVITGVETAYYDGLQVSIGGAIQGDLLLSLTPPIAKIPHAASGTATYTPAVGVGINTFNYSESTTTTGPSLTSIAFSNLKYAGTFFPNSVPLLASVSVPVLTEVGSSFSFSSLPLLTSISAPLLTSVLSNVNISSCNVLTTISLPSLVYIGGDFSTSSSFVIDTVNFPSLATIKGNFSPSFIATTSISLPSLAYVGASITLATITPLTSFTAPLLARVGSIQISSGISNLTTITLGTSSTLKAVNGNVVITANKLTAASVDHVLSQLVVLDGTNGTTLYGSGKTVTLTGGTNAAPTFTGQTSATSSVSTAGGVATLTTASTSPAYTAGDLVTIAGVTPAGYNGTYTVLASPAPSATTFAITNATTGAISVQGTVKRTQTTTEGYYKGQVLKVRGVTLTHN